MRVSIENPIYFDHNASTPIAQEVFEAMLPFLREYYGNPSSDHALGKRGREAIEAARHQVADLIGCQASEVLFTSGGTESNNLAIRGVTSALVDKRHLITSVVEHPATKKPCAYLEHQGLQVSWIEVDRQGTVLVDQIASQVREDTALVTIMHAQNEVGTIQPIAAISSLAHEAGALMHTDAAQTVGKIPLNVREMGVDLVSIAGHKLYAPKGVGALYIRQGTPCQPLVLGAGHEKGLRPGTQNVASIVGLGRACALALGEQQTQLTRQVELCKLLWERLRDEIPGMQRNGPVDSCLPNTLHVSFPKVLGSSLLKLTPGLYASTGSACHAGHESASSVLLAMNLTEEQALGSVRLSIGRQTTEEQVLLAGQMLIQAWKKTTHRLQ